MNVCIVVSWQPMNLVALLNQWEIFECLSVTVVQIVLIFISLSHLPPTLVRCQSLAFSLGGGGIIQFQQAVYLKNKLKNPHLLCGFSMQCLMLYQHLLSSLNYIRLKNYQKCVWNLEVFCGSIFKSKCILGN